MLCFNVVGHSTVNAVVLPLIEPYITPHSHRAVEAEFSPHIVPCDAGNHKVVDEKLLPNTEPFLTLVLLFLLSFKNSYLCRCVDHNVVKFCE